MVYEYNTVHTLAHRLTQALPPATAAPAPACCIELPFVTPSPAYADAAAGGAATVDGCITRAGHALAQHANAHAPWNENAYLKEVAGSHVAQCIVRRELSRKFYF